MFKDESQGLALMKSQRFLDMANAIKEMEGS